MAVILRNGTPRTVTNDTVPIRSSTITISQTGLVSSITGYDGKVIKSINMGYLGDHKVTRLKVKLWQLSNVFVYNYEAAMVFYQEKYGIRNTVTMSSDGTCFYVDIPFDVTKTDGNYQLYFILRERISPATEGGGQVGPVDDPGYREVFVSESFKGVVNNDSGYQFVRNFNWDTQVYDYNVSSIYSSVWTEEVTSVYKTEIYLGGLDTSKTYSFKVDDTIIGSSENEIITIDLPEGIQLTQGEGVVNPQLNHNVLVVYVDLESVNTDKLEKIKFSYPVDFGIPEVSSNIAQKLPIKVEYDQSMTTVVDNKSLGMKLDSYVTPINMLGLKNIISNNTLLPTKKYTIFEKDGIVYVCEAIGDYCWIPFGVTSRSGLWNVSFVVKSNDYTYFTGILKLPVMDNILVKQDIESDTVYTAIQDVDTKYLYDANEYALYAQASGTAKLDYSVNNINQAIGWAFGVSEQFSSDELIAAIDSVVEVNYRLDDFNTNLETHTRQITKLESDTEKLDKSIKKLEEDFSNSSALNLEPLVEKNANDIKSLQDINNVHTQNISSLTIKTNGHAEEINNIKDDIVDLKQADIQMQTDISTNKGRIIALEADGVILENQIAEINKTIEPYKNYRDLILGETARAVEVETKLRSDLDSEAIRAQEVEDSLIELTNQHTVSIDSLEQTTKTNSESISKEREDRLAQESVFSSQLQGVAQKVSRNEESIIQVNNSILQVQNDRSFVKNDFNPEVENQVFVSKIIFVNSEEDLPAIREAGTLYLVREEEE